MYHWYCHYFFQGFRQAVQLGYRSVRFWDALVRFFGLWYDDNSCVSEYFWVVSARYERSILLHESLDDGFVSPLYVSEAYPVQAW